AMNFAGGRGSQGDNNVCNPDALVQAYGVFGKTSRVPMLWVYAANDLFFWPALAHRFYEAFRAGGGNAKFIDAPASGDDGHYLYSTVTRPLWTRRRIPARAWIEQPRHLEPTGCTAGARPARRLRQGRVRALSREHLSAQGFRGRLARRFRLALEPGDHRGRAARRACGLRQMG